ncbi:MAG: fatty acid hydroxylase [Sphingopyxis sp. RIFCSPHIGHO2_01_FULL_65_24]|nr:MAG: fatty acid hydroxylase [Sphingopyxis sp. RIFCSPHIGHO2_01_FULL_65_24]
MFGIYHVIALSMFGVFAALDLLFRARNFPDVPLWRAKGLVFTALYFGVTTYSPLLWDTTLGQYQLVDGSRWPFWAQVVIGFFAYEFLIYAWHRTMHKVQPLWRWLHQMHHSAERVDIWGTFYFHPFDMIGWALVGSCALVLGIGLTAEAALVVSVVATFCTIFQHANVRTPHWLGYLVTRPESHSVHHERGLHAYNYGDIPIFDILLGTFRNPREWHGEAGFFDGSSRQMGKMLVGKEIA